jgi:hypothetical protein
MANADREYGGSDPTSSVPERITGNIVAGKVVNKAGEPIAAAGNRGGRCRRTLQSCLDPALISVCVDEAQAISQPQLTFW